MDKSQYYYIKTYLAALLHVEDRTSMAVSLESRVPLCCDHNLVEFAASIEPRMRATGSQLKNILREAAKEAIPSEVYLRKDKKGFPTPYHVWLRKQINEVRNILLSESAIKRNVFNQSYVEKVIKDFEERTGSRAYTVFMMLCVELWFRMFVDGQKQEAFQTPLTNLT